MNNILVKWAIIFGGGLLAFSLFKPKKKDLAASLENAVESKSSESFDNTESSIKPTKENAEIIITAYTAAVQAGEPSSALAELNKECMKDYGMRCYSDKDGKLVVCDVSGDIILKK